MTASKQAKAAGLVSLRQAAKIINKPERTLYDWHRDNPALFEATILGCVEKLKQNMAEDEKIQEARSEAFAEVIDMLNEMADDTGATIQQSSTLRSAAENVGRME